MIFQKPYDDNNSKSNRVDEMLTIKEKVAEHYNKQ